MSHTQSFQEVRWPVFSTSLLRRELFFRVTNADHVVMANAAWGGVRLDRICLLGLVSLRQTWCLQQHPESWSGPLATWSTFSPECSLVNFAHTITWGTSTLLPQHPVSNFGCLAGWCKQPSQPSVQSGVCCPLCPHNDLGDFCLADISGSVMLTPTVTVPIRPVLSRYCCCCTLYQYIALLESNSASRF